MYFACWLCFSLECRKRQLALTHNHVLQSSCDNLPDEVVSMGIAKVGVLLHPTCLRLDLRSPASQIREVDPRSGEIVKSDIIMSSGNVPSDPKLY